MTTSKSLSVAFCSMVLAVVNDGDEPAFSDSPRHTANGNQEYNTRKIVIFRVIPGPASWCVS